MSCLDVMYHQSYGAHYLPAAAYKATYYNHHHQPQQRKLSVYTKVQECMEPQQQQVGGRGMLSRDQGPRQAPASESGRRSTSDPDLKDCAQPAEAEYLSSRCVLFTYFQGDISDVVDEHFSRALSQSSAFNSEMTKPHKVTQSSASAAAGSWKDGGALSEGQSSPVWSGTYPPQSASCLHPDFSPSPVSFNHPEGALWAGHMLSQAGLPPPAALPDSGSYSLSPQSVSGYASVHDIYHPHPHPHIHARHHHPVLHSYPAHSPALDPRFNPLLLPAGVRSQNQNQAAANTGSSPNSEGVKAEMDPSSSSPVGASSVAWTPSALHGSLEVYDSALDQTKAKTSVWF